MDEIFPRHFDPVADGWDPLFIHLTRVIKDQFKIRTILSTKAKDFPTIEDTETKEVRHCWAFIDHDGKKIWINRNVSSIEGVILLAHEIGHAIHLNRCNTPMDFVRVGVEYGALYLDFRAYRYGWQFLRKHCIHSLSAWGKTTLRREWCKMHSYVINNKYGVITHS